MHAQYQDIMVAFNEQLELLKSGSMETNISEHVDALVKMQSVLDEQNYQAKVKLQMAQIECEQIREQHEMILKDVQQQRVDFDRTNEVYERLQQDVEYERQREAKLIDELNYYNQLMQAFKNKQQSFINLYQDCDQINSKNHTLTHKLSLIEDENQQLEIECHYLEEQANQQDKYLDQLKEQKYISEICIQKLVTYQEVIQNQIQMQLSQPIKENKDKYDPLEYINNMSKNHKSSERFIQQDDQQSQQNLIQSSYSSTGSYLSNDQYCHEKSEQQSFQNELIDEVKKDTPKPKKTYWKGILGIGIVTTIFVVKFRKPLLKLFR